MATVTKDKIYCTNQLSGGSPTPWTFKEAATQTFVKGEVVFISGAFVTELASDAPAAILGVAAQDAHNDAVAGTHDVSVFMAQAETVFTGNMVTTALADYVLLAADQARQAALIRDTVNNKVHLNAAITTQAGGGRVYVIGVDGKTSAVGDTNARVKFVFGGANVPQRTLA